MIKILYIINYIENGGPSKVVLNLMNKLDKKKFEVSLLTLKNKNNELLIKEIESNGINVKQLNYTSNFAIIKNKKNIRNIINSFSSDIIHSHGLIPDFVSSSRQVKSHKVTTIHNNMYEDYINSFGKLKGKLYIYWHQICLKKIDRIICCSKTSYDSLKKLQLNSFYIRNGIDLPPIDDSKDIRALLGIPKNAIVYIYCGNLTYGKRILELVDLMKDNMSDNEYLLILGKGPLYDEVVKKSTANIKVLGFITNVLDYYNISDVYISNSSSEGFSISVIEALGSGLHVLLSDIPSHKECFEIDDKIYIGEYFNSSNFAEKKEKLLSKIQEKRSRETIKNFQKQNLSCHSLIEQYENEYKKLVLK